mgnify:FL=1
MLNLPRGVSDLSHRLPVIVITFDHIFFDIDHTYPEILVSDLVFTDRQPLSHCPQRIFPGEFFAEHL